MMLRPVSKTSSGEKEYPQRDFGGGAEKAHERIELVRPNAFPVARKLEEWARKQGFAVDWYPMPDEDNLTLLSGTPSAQ
ncbi:MAG: hypothetical protein ACP5O7_11555 [Phycisphaerae bacterium]